MPLSGFLRVTKWFVELGIKGIHYAMSNASLEFIFLIIKEKGMEEPRIYNTASTLFSFAATSFASSVISGLPTMPRAATGSMIMTAVLPSSRV